MILEIEEELRLKPSVERFQKEAEAWDEDEGEEIVAEDEEFTGMEGQLFCNCLMDILCCYYEM